jgi:hypothetical protein
LQQPPGAVNAAPESQIAGNSQAVKVRRNTLFLKSPQVSPVPEKPAGIPCAPNLTGNSNCG